MSEGERMTTSSACTAATGVMGRSTRKEEEESCCVGVLLVGGPLPPATRRLRGLASGGCCIGVCLCPPWVGWDGMGG